MSNIYIQEPPTSGKIILKTSVGDIEIELWAKEAPKACRNFVQLCMEKYYSNTIFHRVVKEFIVQGGDPTGTGEGGESIYGSPFKDEFHTRLRFCRRGLVAMANAGKDDNGSQFFFTLGSTPELQNKHTIFGKVAGDTIYNMLKLGEGLVDENERPVYPEKIINAEILNNPFSDIIPRVFEKSKPVKESKKDKTGAVKNFKLLSFGEEAEEDEEETVQINKTLCTKGKSAHDVLSDPKLSSQPAIETMESKQDDDKDSEEEEKEKREITSRIKDKLKNKPKEVDSLDSKNDPLCENEEEEDYFLGKSKMEENKKKVEEIQKEIRDLKNEIRNEKKLKELELKKDQDKKEKKEKEKSEYQEYFQSQAEYKKVKLPKEGKSRDDFTAGLLAQFSNKLNAMKESLSTEEDEETNTEDMSDDSWLAHKLQCEEKAPVLAKDASTKDDQWFEIDDPRNPINKRRRGETTQKSKKFKK